MESTFSGFEGLTSLVWDFVFDCTKMYNLLYKSVAKALIYKPVSILFERVEAHKVVHSALRDYHAVNTITSIKCGGLNALNGLRQGNRSQTIAVIKCISTYIFCALSYYDF